jgi:rhamnose utilization protein RhaD (predicted bifunctional aldolase and dehydrogenase)
MHSSISELIELTNPFSNRSDLIQGPGGNTSYKSSDGKMFIKASGFRFDEMSLSKGVSAVNHLKIRDYFISVNPKDKAKEEAEMLQIINQTILTDTDGRLFPKPSMETGFHAVLDQYVIHTHSVWTNFVNCRKDRKDIIMHLSKTFNIAEIPFVSPGFGLSYLVTDALKQADKNGKNRPDIFFLHNHGVIAHSNTRNHCQQLLTELDEAIKTLTQFSNQYPETKLLGEDSHWWPANNFISEMLKKYNCDARFFEQVLFPDQTVFFKDQMDFNLEDSSKRIAINQFDIHYNCQQRDARAIHETMTAYLFIYDYLKSNGIEIDFINKNEIDYINNMDMEKHRKNIQ